MKKIISVFVVFMLLFGLAACQKDKDTIEDPKPTEPTKTNEPVSDPEPDPEPDGGDEEIFSQIYYCTTKRGFNDSCSTLTLNSDYSFVFDDIEGMGALQAEGYFAMNDVALVCLVDNDFTDHNGNKVTTIEFEIVDAYTIRLKSDTSACVAGDYFSETGVYDAPKSDYPVDYPMTFKSVSDWFDDVYEPEIQFTPAGTFTMTENTFAQMAEIKGWYEKDDDGYTCHVTDNTSMQGFAGQDVMEIRFSIISDDVIQLDTEICGSQKGDCFKLIEE